MRDEKMESRIKMLIFFSVKYLSLLVIIRMLEKTHTHCRILFNHIYFQHGRFSYIIDQFDHQNIYKILGAILV